MNPVYIMWGVIGGGWIALMIWLCVTPLMDGFDLSLNKIIKSVTKEARARTQRPQPPAPSYPRLMDPSHYRKDNK